VVEAFVKVTSYVPATRLEIVVFRFTELLLPDVVPDQEIDPEPEPTTKIAPSEPLQELGGFGVKVITGVGFIEIEYVKVELVQPFNVAVAEIVPDMSLPVLLDARLNGKI
jgi:hypothetical protein